MKYILILLTIISLYSCTPEPEPQNTPATETNDPDDNEPGVGGWEPGDSGETPAEPE